MRTLILSFGHPRLDGRVARLARAYGALGAAVRIAVPATERAGGVANGLLRRASGLSAAVRALADERFDLVHACDLETLPAALLFKPRGAKVLLDLHDLPPRPFRPLLPLARFADRIVTVNDALADRFAVALPRRPAPLENWTLAAERDDARRLRSDGGRERMRAELGLRPADFALVYAGSLHRGRGLELLALAAREAPEGVRIFILGAGPLPAPAGVTALPPVAPERLVARLVFADAGLIPYPGAGGNQRLGLPSKLFEYTAAGLPVVATPMPLVAARIARHGFGLVFPSGDPRALLAAVATLRRDPAPRRAAALAYAARRDLRPALAALLPPDILKS